MAGKIIVYTFVVADLIHVGHLRALQQAKALGDPLIVAVLTDEATVASKRQPIIPFEERMELAANLKCVDEVMGQDNVDPTENLKKLDVDILTHGDDWDENFPGAKYMRSIGKKAIRTKYYPYQSTSKIIEKIRIGPGLGLPSITKQQTTKETMREVKKVWGKEVIVVNNDKYCGKFLCLDKGAESSYHRHLKKQETFYSLKGQATLTIEGKDYMLNPYSRPKTIKPGQLHGFRGIIDSLILEISTHHDDKDVYRISGSKSGKEDISL